MTDMPCQRLSGNEIAALIFAARRQLTRWANRADLQPHQGAQRAALVRAVRVLEDRAFNDGCDLRAAGDG
jgi:hypothetical protein